jgi:hypothetical protein
MNCANHPQREGAAFCQHCGKPLCPDCVRNVGSSVFCESCLAARVGATPPAGYGTPPAYPPYPSYPPVAPSIPNPGLAALLGFIPGVGAMYNEQYAKGLVHLLIFAVLVMLSHEVGIFGLFVFGWIVYMVIEAYHTARARRDGTPLPNPFGLNDFSERLFAGHVGWPGASNPPSYGVPQNPDPAGQPAVDPTAGPGANVPPASPNPPPYSYPYAPPGAPWASGYGAPPVPPIPPVPPVSPMPPYPDPTRPSHHRFPSGAIWLIAIGLFFLLGNTLRFHLLYGRFLGPILLIGFGVWLFVHMMAGTVPDPENGGSQLSRWRLARAIRSSFWIVLTGVLWLLHVLGIIPWSRSWPIYLIAAGVMLLINRSFYSGYAPYRGPAATPPPVSPAGSTEIAPSGPWRDRPGNQGGQ